jgi:hypothetical protein
MLAASTWLVTSALRSGPGSPAFFGFPPPFHLPPMRSWLVTSRRARRVAPSPTSLDLDARLAASDHRLSPVRDLFFVEPALTGCDVPVDTRRVHTAAASPDAAEMSNDTRCSALSSASRHRLATAPAPPHRHPTRHRHDRRWIHHRRRSSPVSWLSRIHSPPRGGSGADRPLWATWSSSFQTPWTLGIVSEFRGLLRTAHSLAHLRIAGPIAVPLLPSPLHARRKARYRPAWLA